MITLLLALQVQSPWTTTPATVTVGDTVLVVRRLVTEGGVQARIEPLTDAGVVVQLSDPRASYAEGSVTIQYTIAAFAPGTLAVNMPDAEFLFPDGRSELIRGDTAWVVVTSVLPEEASAPRALREPIGQSPRRAWPLVVLVSSVLASTVGWGMLRRRRRARRDVPDPHTRRPYPAVDRWIAAGEGRAVTAYVHDRVRGALSTLVPEANRHLDTDTCVAVVAAERPDLPIHEIGGVLRDLERARFAPVVRGEVVDVVDRAERLLESLDATIAKAST